MLLVVCRLSNKITLTNPERSNSTKVGRSCVHSFCWLRSLLLVVKSENRDECKIVRLFPIGVDCVKLVHLSMFFFFSDCSLRGSSKWDRCAFVQRFRRVFWHNPQVHAAVVVRYSWDATVVAIMVLVMNLYSAFSSHTFQCAFYKESIYECDQTSAFTGAAGRVFA